MDKSVYRLRPNMTSLVFRTANAKPKRESFRTASTTPKSTEAPQYIIYKIICHFGSLGLPGGPKSNLSAGDVKNIEKISQRKGARK